MRGNGLALAGIATYFFSVRDLWHLRLPSLSIIQVQQESFLAGDLDPKEHCLEDRIYQVICRPLAFLLTVSPCRNLFPTSLADSHTYRSDNGAF